MADCDCHRWSGLATTEVAPLYFSLLATCNSYSRLSDIEDIVTPCFNKPSLLRRCLVDSVFEDPQWIVYHGTRSYVQTSLITGRGTLLHHLQITQFKFSYVEQKARENPWRVRGVRNKEILPTRFLNLEISWRLSRFPGDFKISLRLQDFYQISRFPAINSRFIEISIVNLAEYTAVYS